MVVSRLSLIVHAKLVLNSRGSLLWHVVKDKNEAAEIKKRIRS